MHMIRSSSYMIFLQGISEIQFSSGIINPVVFSDGGLIFNLLKNCVMTFNMFGIEDNFPSCKTDLQGKKEKIRKMACAQRKNEGTIL